MARDGLPEPMRVCDQVIERCRREIEGGAKRSARAILLLMLKKIYGFQELGEGFQWGHPLSVPKHDIRVGRYVYIGANGSMIGPVVIGDLTMVSTHVHFVGNDHRTDVIGSPTRLEFSDVRPITIIEADCWIGQGAVIREGIIIGRGAVVGANSLVTKSVPPYAIVGGTPAHLIRMRFGEEEIIRHERHLFGVGPQPAISRNGIISISQLWNTICRRII
jgi:acetyltransferase-like isoleucine patch superfamily enzyme